MSKPAHQKRQPSRVVTALLPLVLAASFGGVLYLVTSSLPYLLATGGSDRVFGGLNACLQREAGGRLSSVAPAADAKALAGASAERVVRCRADVDAGEQAQVWALPSVGALAFDYDGTLWAAAERAVYQLPAGAAPQPVGDVAAAALVGTRFGAVALESSTGRLLALSHRGAVSGTAQLPQPPVGPAELSVSADGTRVALIVGGGIFVFDAQTLATLRAEAPCQVEFAWWRSNGHRAVLACGPKHSWALEYDVDSGATQAVTLPATRSTLVPARGIAWLPCDGVACSTPAL